MTVAEIARDADVAEETVFNYFPTKEDLFYGRLEAFEERAARGDPRPRRRARSILEAFGRFLLAPRGLFAADADEAHSAQKQLRAITRMITEARRCSRASNRSSPATPTRSRPSSPRRPVPAGRRRALVAANALIGIHHALIEFVRKRTLAGDDDRTRLARRPSRPGKRGVRPTRTRTRPAGRAVTLKGKESSDDPRVVLCSVDRFPLHSGLKVFSRTISQVPSG